MKRRNFLRQSTLASSLFFVPNFVKAFEQVAKASLGYKKLVIVQLSGGNDGLNTIVPFTNDIYYKNRPGISIPKKDLIKVTDDLGFNKSLHYWRNKNLEDNLNNRAAFMFCSYWNLEFEKKFRAFQSKSTNNYDPNIFWGPPSYDQDKLLTLLDKNSPKKVEDYLRNCVLEKLPSSIALYFSCIVLI